MYFDSTGHSPEWYDVAAWIGVGLFAAAAIVLTAGLAGAVIGGVAGRMGLTGAGIAISSLGKIALAGTSVLTGVLSGLVVMVAQWKPGSWPGDDPTVSPGDGFEWRGQLPVVDDKGAWVNPSTGDSLHPDFNHPQPIELH